MRKDEEIRILKADVQQLSEAVDYLEVENAALKEELHKLTIDLATAHECKLSAISNAGGISCFNLTSKEYHSRYPKACKVIFGFKSFSDMTCRLKCFFPAEIIDPNTNDLPVSMLGEGRRSKYLLN